MKIDATHQIIVLNLRDPSERELARRIDRFIIHNRQGANAGCGSASPGAAVHGFINDTMTDFVIMVNPGFQVTYRNADGRFESPHNENEIMANIIAYCIIKESATAYEIWDVCVLGSRGRGIGPAFIQLLCRNIPLPLLDIPRTYKPFWLIVVPGNTPAAKTYLRNGFSLGPVTLLDSSNMASGFATPNISMTCPNPYVPTDNIAQLAVFTRTSETLMAALVAKTLIIYLPANVLMNMDILVTTFRHETCGALVVTGVEENPAFPGYRALRLGMSKLITKGYINPQNCVIPYSDFGYHIHHDSLLQYNAQIVQIPSAGDINGAIIYSIVSCIHNKTTMCAQFIFLRNGIFTITIDPVFAQLLFTTFRIIENDKTHEGVTLITNSLERYITGIYHTFIHAHAQTRGMLQVPGRDYTSYTDQERFVHGTEICRFINTITIQNLLQGDITGELVATINQYEITVGRPINAATTQLVTATYHAVNDRTQGINIICPNVLLTDIGLVQVHDPAQADLENGVIPVDIFRQHMDGTPEGGTFRL